MKKLLVPCIAVLLVSSAMAVDKKPIEDVDIYALTGDTQVGFHYGPSSSAAS